MRIKRVAALALCLLALAPAAFPPQTTGTVIGRILDEQGQHIARVWIGGVNFLTGQLFDMARITKRAHANGCAVGWDLAHAAGNIPVQLHDWDIDFAAWCSYKYLNAGPGAVAGGP